VVDWAAVSFFEMTSNGNLLEGQPRALPAMSPPTTPLSVTADLQEFVCGWGAAIINITITFPLNKIIFRQVRGQSLINIKKYFDN
jgi:hypothetical protein